MVLSLLGRRHDDLAVQYIQIWERFASVLNDMGLIDREKIDSFYIPMYGPSEEELREIIEVGGSYEINQIMVGKSVFATTNVFMNPRTMANEVRALLEPIIVQHFGPSEEIMAEFVRSIEKDYMRRPINAPEEDAISYIFVSLSRRI